jgi:hypothetical protein
MTKRTSGFEIGISMFVNADGTLGLFENGLRQNVIFLYHLFRAMPDCARVWLINGGDGELTQDVGAFGVDASDIVRLDRVSARLDFLVTMGAALNPNTVRQMRARGCKVIGYKGGNGAIISLEAVVARGKRLDGERYFDADHYDQIWLTPQHMHSFAGWCRTMYRCPVREIPHIWSPRILHATVGKSYGYKPGRRPWRVGVMDPNITVMKTSHVPMLVCEAAFRQSPEAFAAFYIANGLRLRDNGHFASFALHLSAVQAKIMTLEPRFVGTEFLRDHCDALVTHQWENALNYLYWEALYGGFPLIHNSPRIADIGYHYGDFDAEAGGAALVQAQAMHDEQLAAYRDKADAFIATLDPTATTNMALHRQALIGDQKFTRLDKAPSTTKFTPVV